MTHDLFSLSLLIFMRYWVILSSRCLHLFLMNLQQRDKHKNALASNLSGGTQEKHKEQQHMAPLLLLYCRYQIHHFVHSYTN